MNIQQFNHLVNSTRQHIDDEDTKRLENLVTSFPYCQTGHLLLSKASREQGSMLSEMRIKVASAYSVNRRHLKAFLLQENTLEKEAIEVEEPLIQDEIGATKKKNDEVVEQPKIEKTTEESVVLEEKSTLDDSLDVQEKEEESTASTIAEEIHQSLQELKKLKEEVAEEKVTQEDEKVESVTESSSQTEIEQKIETPVEEDVEFVQKNKEELKEVSSTEKETKESPKKTPAAVKDKLKALSEKVKKDAEKKVKRKKKPVGEVNHHIPSEDLFDSKLGESGGAKENSEADLILRYLESIDKKKSKRANRKTQDAILDNFIKNEPQISRITPSKVKANEPQEDFSKGSTRLKVTVVNENMAKIHAKQGNIGKAIKIYQALIVKKPEKKSYFAAQIETLKKEQ